MRYVQGERKDEGCIFRLAAKTGADRARLLLRRGERCLAMLNAFPCNSGHLMVGPFRHVASIEHLDDEELLELMTGTICTRVDRVVGDVLGDVAPAHRARAERR